MWVCGSCLVKNEASHRLCVCCEQPNHQGGSVEEIPSGELGQQNTNEIPQVDEDPKSLYDEVEQYKLTNRIRMEFKKEDLKHKTLFIAGSGEMEQIPYECLDKCISPVNNGVETVYECSIPMPLKDMPSSIQAVECGALHTAFLTSSGSLYTYGCNDMGALGRLPPEKDKTPKDSEDKSVDGDKDDDEKENKPKNSGELEDWEREPGKVETKFRVKQISSGDNHTLILSVDGHVYITGGFKDTSGDIGIADYTFTKELKKVRWYTVPVKVPINEPIQSIASGENHCVCLAEGGQTIYTFGSNEFSQLIISNDEVQNPTETEVDVSDVSKLKLLLTWPQRIRVSDLIKKADTKPKKETPKSGEENEANGNKDDAPVTRSKKQSYNTRSTTTKKIIPPARRTRGNGKAKDSNTFSPSRKLSKRGRTDTEVVTRIFTGNCTTFFQTKKLKLYGVGRNGQGEVGVGSEDLIIDHPRELVFFRGVEITELRGGQFFTVALVEKRIFTWGMLSYLGLPKEYDRKDCTEIPVAPRSDESNKQEDVEMEEDENIALVDKSKLLTFTCHSEDPSIKETAAIGRVTTFVNTYQGPSAQTSNANGQQKMLTLKLLNLKDGAFSKECKYIRMPESVFLSFIEDDIYKVPDKIRVKVDSQSKPMVLGKVASFVEAPSGYNIPDHLLINMDPVTRKPLNMNPELKKYIVPDYPHQQMPVQSSVQVLNPDHKIPQVPTPVSQLPKVPKPFEPSLQVPNPVELPQVSNPVQKSPQQLNPVEPLLQVPNPEQPTLQVPTPVQLPQAPNPVEQLPQVQNPFQLLSQVSNPVQQSPQVINPFIPLHQVPNPVNPSQRVTNPLQPSEQVSHQGRAVIHRPFYQEVKTEKQGSKSEGPGVGPPDTKRRNVKGTRLKVELQAGIERIFQFDYTERYEDAFRRGKATEPILLPMKGPVKTIFTGADTLFAVLSDNSLYSWGSAQNYILGNGKDEYYEETPQMVPKEHFPGFKVIGGAGGAQHTVFIAEKCNPW